MRKGLKKFVKIVVYAHLILAVAVLLTHCSFKRYAAKSYEQAKKNKPYDVVIVPGVPYEKENTTGVMNLRLFWSKHLYDSGFTHNIIFSGSAVYSPFVEGIVMKVMADSLGIPSDHTFSETKAEHSTENVYYSWKMARSMGFKKIALATDAFQARMLKSFIRKYCPDVESIPIVDEELNIGKKALPVIDTTASYVQNFVSITKRESFWQRFKGTMGKRVKEEVKKEEDRDETKTGE